MAVTFDTLNVDAKIFQELAKKPDLVGTYVLRALILY